MCCEPEEGGFIIGVVLALMLLPFVILAAILAGAGWLAFKLVRWAWRNRAELWDWAKEIGYYAFLVVVTPIRSFLRFKGYGVLPMREANERRKVDYTARLIDRDATNARYELNQRLGQGWRNLAEPVHVTRSVR